MIILHSKGMIRVPYNTVKNRRTIPNTDSIHPSLALLNAGVIYVSKQLEVRIYNDLALELLACDGEVGNAVALADVLNPHREEYQMIVSILEAEHEYRDVVVTWEVKGRIRHVLLDAFAEDTDKQFSGMFFVLRDIGNFSAMDQTLQRFDKMATVGKVAAGVAHEIRNPLTTVRGFLQVLTGRCDTDSRVSLDQYYLQMMLDEIDRVDALVDKLLLLSKPQRLKFHVYSMTDFLEQLHQEILRNTSGHAVLYSFRTEVDGLVEMDLPLLQRAVLQLVQNAVEAMEHGGELTVIQSVKNGYATIDVVDTGPGIPYYQMDKIFDAFFTTKEKGIGLGLPICQRIVADHSGDIRVSSKGYGSTFQIRIPVRQRPEMLGSTSSPVIL